MAFSAVILGAAEEIRRENGSKHGGKTRNSIAKENTIQDFFCRKMG